MRDPVQIARRRAKAKRGFFIHLVVALFIVAILFFINMMTDPYYWWVVWPLFGLSIPLVVHYLAAFGIPGTGKLDQEWEDRQTAAELKRMGIRLEEEPEDLQLPPLREKAKVPQAGKWGEQDLV